MILKKFLVSPLFFYGIYLHPDGVCGNNCCFSWFISDFFFFLKPCKLTYKLKEWVQGAVKHGENTHYGNNELESHILKRL